MKILCYNNEKESLSYIPGRVTFILRYHTKCRQMFTIVIKLIYNIYQSLLLGADNNQFLFKI